jgi:hypothetical protein
MLLTRAPGIVLNQMTDAAEPGGRLSDRGEKCIGLRRGVMAHWAARPFRRLRSLRI